MTGLYGGALPDNAAATAQPDMLSSGAFPTLHDILSFHAGGGVAAYLAEGLSHAFPEIGLSRAITENAATYGYDPSTGTMLPDLAAAPQMSAEEATKQYGIAGALRFDNPVPESVAAEMNAHKRDELARQDIINRSPVGPIAGAALQFAGGLPAVVDPLMIASSFIPVVPAARAAIMSASLGGRVALHAIQGAAAGAALTPVFYGLAKQDQEDYGAVDALLNIAMGGIAGAAGGAVFGREAGLHGMTGGSDDGLAHADPRGMVDIGTAPPETREALLRGAVSALADDRPVDLPARLLAETAPGATPYERLPAAPMRLASWLQQQGGVIDEGGDLAALDAGRARPGLINQAGMSPEAAAEAAWQEGYLRGNDIGSGAPAPSELIDALAQDLRGNPVYSDQDELQVTAHRDAMGRNAEIDRYAQDFGISTEDKTRTQFWDEVADHLSQEDLAREIASHDEAHETAFADAERRAQEWTASRGEAWEPDHDVGTPRTLDDMEQSYRQEEIARTAATGNRGAEGAEPAGFDQGALQAGDRQRGGGLGARQRGIDEGHVGGFGADQEVDDPLDHVEEDVAAVEAEIAQAREAGAAGAEHDPELDAAEERVKSGNEWAKAVLNAGACLIRRA